MQIDQSLIMHVAIGAALALLAAYKFGYLKLSGSPVVQTKQMSQGQAGSVPESVVHHVIHDEVQSRAQDSRGNSSDEPSSPTHYTSITVPFEIAVTPQKPTGNPAAEFGFGHKP